MHNQHIFGNFRQRRNCNHPNHSNRHPRNTFSATSSNTPTTTSRLHHIPIDIFSTRGQQNVRLPEHMLSSFLRQFTILGIENNNANAISVQGNETVLVTWKNSISWQVYQIHVRLQKYRSNVYRLWFIRPFGC